MVVPVCVPNTKETDGDEFVSILSPEEALEEFKRLGLDIAVKTPRSGGMALEDMKMVAKLCGISSNLKKQAMAESINTHLCNRAKLLPYVFADKQPLSNLSIFKKDKTCIPRLCNILFSKYKDELAQSSLAATREQLQFGEIRDKAPFWGNLAEDFSNPSEDAGGLIREDSALKDIDVNKIITVMTAKEAYHLFNDTMKAYRSAKRNWCASGQHQGLNFWRFTTSTDCLYLHLWVEVVDNQPREQYINEGSLIEGGLAWW